MKTVGFMVNKTVNKQLAIAQCYFHTWASAWKSECCTSRHTS